MSRLQLKKEIAALDRNQLEQMVLDAYSSRKEIKEYFDFFLRPDVGRLIEKYKTSLSKELTRSKRGHSKARISVIKKLIKDFEGFHTGFDNEIDLLLYLISFALATESNIYFSETLLKGVGALMLKMIELADHNLVADKILSQLTMLLDNEAAGTRHFRRYLREVLQTVRP